jgi:hypothetical protein
MRRQILCSRAALCSFHQIFPSHGDVAQARNHFDRTRSQSDDLNFLQNIAIKVVGKKRKTCCRLLTWGRKNFRLRGYIILQNVFWNPLFSCKSWPRWMAEGLLAACSACAVSQRTDSSVKRGVSVRGLAFVIPEWQIFDHVKIMSNKLFLSNDSRKVTNEKY